MGRPETILIIAAALALAFTAAHTSAQGIDRTILTQSADRVVVHHRDEANGVVCYGWQRRIDHLSCVKVR